MSVSYPFADNQELKQLAGMWQLRTSGERQNQRSRILAIISLSDSYSPLPDLL
jgi:hypothetical protein